MAPNTLIPQPPVLPRATPSVPTPPTSVSPTPVQYIPSGEISSLRTMRDDALVASRDEEARHIAAEHETERIKVAEKGYSFIARMTGKAHREVVAQFAKEKEQALRAEADRRARIEAEEDRIRKAKEEAAQKQAAEEARQKEDATARAQAAEERAVREIRERAMREGEERAARVDATAVIAHEISSPELSSIEERVKGTIALKVAETISHQRKALADKAVEIAEMAARKEMMRAEVLGIIEAEKRALTEMKTSVEQEERSFAETEKDAIRQKRIRAEEVARRAKSTAGEKKRQAEEAEEVAREKRKEAEDAEAVSIREQAKAVSIAATEETEVAAVDRRMQVAITFAEREIGVALDHVRTEAAKITAVQERARSADAQEKLELAPPGMFPEKIVA